MLSQNEYRHHAIQLVRLANTATDQTQKASLISLVEQWDELAARLEALSRNLRARGQSCHCSSLERCAPQSRLDAFRLTFRPAWRCADRRLPSTRQSPPVIRRNDAGLRFSAFYWRARRLPALARDTLARAANMSSIHENGAPE